MLYKGLDVNLVNTSTYSEVRIKEKEKRMRQGSCFTDFKRLLFFLKEQGLSL